jgi:Zn-dependent protease with chaperone function
MQARYFDGSSARGQPVRLELRGRELIAHRLESADAADAPGAEPLRWALRRVEWPERTRHLRRVIHLKDGGSIDIDDAAAFDAWAANSGRGESWVVRAQQRWRSTLVALVLLVLAVAVGYRWGVPLLADTLVALVPGSADRAVGEAGLDTLDQRFLAPSELPPGRQQALRQALEQMLAAAYPRPQDQVPWQLHFRKGGKAIGPNALALPGGTIIVTDELVQLLQGHDDALLGVMAHEYGHITLRHGMRSLVRFTLISAATSVALGDFSAVVANVPAILGQLGYSRDAEREADAVAATVLRASGRSPAVMVVLFERLKTVRGAEAKGEGLGPPIALASHPHDEERIRFFREAATVR